MILDSFDIGDIDMEDPVWGTPDVLSHWHPYRKPEDQRWSMPVLRFTCCSHVLALLSLYKKQVLVGRRSRRRNRASHRPHSQHTLVCCA